MKRCPRLCAADGPHEGDCVHVAPHGFLVKCFGLSHDLQLLHGGTHLEKGTVKLDPFEVVLYCGKCDRKHTIIVESAHHIRRTASADGWSVTMRRGVIIRVKVALCPDHHKAAVDGALEDFMARAES